MIILVLKDGLGNQLFQYAAARALAKSLNTKLLLDISSFKYNKVRKYSLCHFQIQANIASDLQISLFRLVTRVFNLINYKNRSRKLRFNFSSIDYAPLIGTVQRNAWIEGYWQSEKYFHSIEELIRHEFVVISPINAYCADMLKLIKNTNSVSLHIRRGDYVNDAIVHSIHGVCSLDYYINAIKLILLNVESPLIFVFSDDITWVKNNLLVDTVQFVYVDDDKRTDYDDLRMMYSCKHNIISNSSFSWWGAWLNSFADKIVIAPKKWVNHTHENPDILPEKWLQIDP